jgi:hypothetical protein
VDLSPFPSSKAGRLIEARGLIRGESALLAKIEKPQALERSTASSGWSMR